MGENVPRTLKFTRTIHDQHIFILLDSNSTYNFVQSKIAQCIGLPILPSSQIKVMVRNGQTLKCEGHCNNILILNQGVEFCITIHGLPIKGIKLVLGIP